jgi:HNH endonuclease
MQLFQASADGMFRYARDQKLIEPAMDASGHLFVSWADDERACRQPACKLVFHAWLGTVRDGYQIHHDDDDATNNAWCNLRLITPLVKDTQLSHYHTNSN